MRHGVQAVHIPIEDVVRTHWTNRCDHATQVTNSSGHVCRRVLSHDTGRRMVSEQLTGHVHLLQGEAFLETLDVGFEI
jgi:hypothetical protein